jgi:hypothetical protein
MRRVYFFVMALEAESSTSSQKSRVYFYAMPLEAEHVVANPKADSCAMTLDVSSSCLSDIPELRMNPRKFKTSASIQ